MWEIYTSQALFAGMSVGQVGVLCLCWLLLASSVESGAALLCEALRTPGLLMLAGALAGLNAMNLRI